MGDPTPAAACTACSSTNGSSTAVPADPRLMELPARDARTDVELVALGQKNVPLFEIPAKAREAIPTCVLRAKVDVTGIKRKLEEGGERLWSTDEAASTNVALTRPSHDAWGIGKIVFVYCDDFLMRTFEMPWFHDPEWRSLLAPVFASAGIPINKIVRCLLARMPPGICIPPHHDTGYWVNYTHRLHLPIITSPDHVIFRIGPTVDSMVRINFPEGSLIELNNQSKHAVDNCWDRHRVHLIFDYVEDFAIERIVLKAGDRVHQTRRSIDLDTEKGRRPCPSFIILGAQKCGTTSMYEYLTQHPLVLRARRRETHYFDWRWRADLKTTKEHVDMYSNFFYKSILDENPSCLSGESTPSYLLHSDRVLPRIREIAPHAKLIIMLRDPVARAYSQYQMVIDPEGTPEQKKARGTHWVGKTFEQVVRDEMEDLKKHGISESTTYEEFRDRYLASRPMGYGSHSLLGRGLYALQLKPWLDAYGPEQLLVLAMEDMKTTEGTHDQIDKVFKFLGLPEHRIIDPDAKNTRKYDPMSQETKEMLKRFYEPYNRQLFDLLGRDFDWSK